MTQTQLKRADASVEETRVSTYDKGGNLLSRSDLHGSTSYAYDALGRVTSETQTNSTTAVYDHHVVHSSYDPAGNRTKVVYQGGRTLVSRFDRANRLTSLTDGALVTTHAYDAAGNRTSQLLPNGQSMSAAFDALNRVTLTTSTIPATGAVIYGISYQYDLAGNRRFATEQLAGQSERDISWGYDGLYRLTSESWTGPAPRTYTYAYDPAGNRLTMAVTPSGGSTTITTSTYVSNRDRSN